MSRQTEQRQTEQQGENRPTVLLVGRGEPLGAALRAALDRNGLFVEEAEGDVRSVVKMTAPDLVVLVGDAAADGGREALDALASDPLTASVPVAVVGPTDALDVRVRAFRHGAVAAIPREASVHAMAARIASLLSEMGENARVATDLGEATLEDLVRLVGRELRDGILSVEPARRKERDGPPLRIVLGAGRPVAEAVEEFVRKLAPLVSRAEPLSYELHRGPGGTVALLDADSEGSVDPRVFEGLRMVVVDSDAARADALAQDLRARGARVVVTDVDGGGLERARALDPDVVLVDVAGIDGEGFEVIRRIRADPRLRWASLLVVPWDELWPSPDGVADLGRLAEQVAPLVVPERVLRERAGSEHAFETRLEATGPSRLIRALAASNGPLHVSVRSPRAVIELDLAEGLVVGATGATSRGERLEGARALAAMLALGSGRARVEHRPHAATANLMVPVDEALALADREPSPIAASMPPPASPDPSGGRRGSGTADRSWHGLGAPPLLGTRVRPPSGRVTPQDLRWTDSSLDRVDFAAAFEERTREVEIPSVPPGVARPSLPTGIATASTEMSVAAPLPTAMPSAAAARRSAFAAAEPDAPASSSAPTQQARPTPVVPMERLGASVAARAEPSSGPSNRSGGFRSGLAGARPYGAAALPAASRTAGSGVQTGAKGAVAARPSARPPAAAFAAGPDAGPSSPGASSAPVAASPGRTVAFGTASTPGADTLARRVDDGGVAGRSEVASARFPRQTRVASGIHGEPVPPPPPRPALPTEASPQPPRDRGESPHRRPREEPDELRSADVARTDRTSEERSSPIDERCDAPADHSIESSESAARDPRASDVPAVPAVLEVADEDARELRPRPVADAPRVPGIIEAPSRPIHRKIDASDFRSFVASSHDAHETSAARPLVDLDTAASGAAAAPGAATSSAAATPPVLGAKAAEPAPASSPSRGSVARLVGVLGILFGAIAVLAVLAVRVWRRPSSRSSLPPGPSVTAREGPARSTSSSAVDEEPIVGARGTEGPEDSAGSGDGPGEPTVGAAAEIGPENLDDALDPPSASSPSPSGTTESIASSNASTDALVDEHAVAAPADPSGSDNAADWVRAAADARDDPTRERLYRRALELDPRNHHAMLGLAEVLLRRGQPQQAIPLIEGAIRRRRSRAEYRVLLGDARRQAGDLEGAEVAWREALEIDPNHRAARQRLGE